MRLEANNYKTKELIKILREWSELTQEEFASKVNISKSTIQNYEQGKRNYTFKTLLDICEKNNIKIVFEKK